MMGGMGFGLIGLFFMILFWILLIVAFVWGAKVLIGRSPQDWGQEHRQSPREILDQRYARGEISREQYEQMKQDIG